MDLNEALKILDNIAYDWKFGKPVRYEAYQTLRSLVLGATPNNARDEICPSCKSTYVVFDQRINKYRCCRCPYEWDKHSPVA